jgi:galactokinase
MNSTISSTPARVAVCFRERFGEEPLLVRSPGRVNIIGEHTDYNHGFVLPAAIDRAMTVAVAPRRDAACTFFAVDLEESHECVLDAPVKSQAGWPNYLIGVADQLRKDGHAIGGFSCAFGGNIPIGAGLSSSAAMETGLAYALNELFHLGIPKLKLAQLSQAAENEFVGVKCGIMDQYASIFGEADSVLRVDCRSLDHTCYPFPTGTDVVLFNTGVSHSLASSEYNRRRRECAEGAEVVRNRVPGVTHLRDVTTEMLEAARGTMSPVVYRRCSYVVRENLRVQEACAALARNDLGALGALMFDTHEGLSRDYEVSCPELDLLVSLAREERAVYGARMMGGGFGGCTITLVDHQATAATVDRITDGYRRKLGRIPEVYVTTISEGTRVICAE